MRGLFGLLTFFVSSFAFAQVSFSLPKELSEISGLEKLNDSTLLAINDGGNDPDIFLLNLNGQIIRKIRVSNASNIDWEALAIDENYLYIGDIGNNMNQREDLCIYRIKRGEIMNAKALSAEKMAFRYREQTSFPPIDQERYFDAEAMTIFEGQIWLFTKNSTKPFDGISYIYAFQFESNKNKELQKTAQLKLNKTSYLKDAITSACTQGQSIILTTYNRMIKLEFPKQGLTKSNLFFYPHIQQVEACVCLNDNTYFISTEKNKFLGAAKFTLLKLP